MFKRFGNQYRKNLSLAYPVIISQLGHTLVALSDSLIVGHKGAIPLASVALGNAVFTVIMMLGIGISFGLTPLIAQENGKSNPDACGQLLKNSLLINLLTGILLFILTELAIRFLDRIGEPVEVVKNARPFMHLLAFSVIPLMFFLTCKQFAEGLGFTRQAMFISIAGNILNILLGITLVFGFFGIRSMGVLGVGISTLTDRVLMGLSMTGFVFFNKRFTPYLLHLKSAFSKRLILDILKIGVPVAMQYLFELSAFTGAAIMIGWMGADQLAAHQIALSLAAMTYMMASGLSAAATIHTGTSFGKQHFNELKLMGFSSYHLVFFLMSLTAIIFISCNHLLPQLFIRNKSVLSYASGLLVIAGLFQLFDGFQVVGLGILRGMSDVRIPTLITFAAYWIVGLPLGYVLGFMLHLGARGIWIGLLIGLACAAGLLFLRFLSKTREHKVLLNRQITA